MEDVKVVRNSDGSVSVDWTPLSLVEARGFPLYIITYTSDDGSTTGSVNTTTSSIVITGLNQEVGYVFTVQVATGNGNVLGPVTAR